IGDVTDHRRVEDRMDACPVIAAALMQPSQAVAIGYRVTVLAGVDGPRHACSSTSWQFSGMSHYGLECKRPIFRPNIPTTRLLARNRAAAIAETRSPVSLLPISTGKTRRHGTAF